MSGQVLSNVAMLLGVLLIVGGTVAVLLTGLDPLYSLPGVAAIIGGCGAVWWGQSNTPDAPAIDKTLERSVQRTDSSDNSKHVDINHKI